MISLNKTKKCRLNFGNNFFNEDFPTDRLDDFQSVSDKYVYT